MELRAPCEHGRFVKHKFRTPDPDFLDPGASIVWTCPGGHPVEGGEKVGWCEEHHSPKADIWKPGLGDVVGRVGLAYCWAWSLLYNDAAFPELFDIDCRMVERFLLMEAPNV